MNLDLYRSSEICRLGSFATVLLQKNHSVMMNLTQL